MHRLISKVSRVLNLFSPQQPEWGVREAAEALDLPKSTMGDILLSLAEQGLLSRTATGHYRLGWRLFELSQTLLEHTAFCVEARPVMQELIERWGVTTHLAVLDSIQVLIVEKFQGTLALQILLSRAGARFPAHAGALGKVLLAAQAPYTLAHLLEGQKLTALTPNTISSHQRLEQELEQIRDRGYASDHEEMLQGLCCVAAPIYDYDGHVLAAMSLTVPASRLLSREDQYIEIIMRAAQNVSEKLGYHK